MTKIIEIGKIFDIFLSSFRLVSILVYMRLSKATIMPVQEIIFVSIFVQKDKKGTGVFTRDVQCVRNKDVN